MSASRMTKKDRYTARIRESFFQNEKNFPLLNTLSEKVACYHQHKNAQLHVEQHRVYQSKEALPEKLKISYDNEYAMISIILPIIAELIEDYQDICQHAQKGSDVYQMAAVRVASLKSMNTYFKAQRQTLQNIGLLPSELVTKAMELANKIKYVAEFIACDTEKSYYAHQALNVLNDLENKLTFMFDVSALKNTYNTLNREYDFKITEFIKAIPITDTKLNDMAVEAVKSNVEIVIRLLIEEDKINVNATDSTTGESLLLLATKMQELQKNIFQSSISSMLRAKGARSFTQIPPMPIALHVFKNEELLFDENQSTSRFENSLSLTVVGATLWKPQPKRAVANTKAVAPTPRIMPHS